MATSMKASELRIGNYINSGKSGNGIVKAIFGHDVILIDSITGEEWQPELENCNSIPLTEEWLVKFGLPEDRATLDLFGNYDLWFERVGDEMYLKSETHQKKISFVHDAQNIYFQIKGEELTIK